MIEPVAPELAEIGRLILSHGIGFAFGLLYASQLVCWGLDHRTGQYRRIGSGKRFYMNDLTVLVQSRAAAPPAARAPVASD